MSAIPEVISPLNAVTLREMALRHLARFATTEQGLARVLERSIMRWARKAAQSGMENEDVERGCIGSRLLIVQIVDDMRRLGALDDATFARSRALSLSRSGRSRRAIAASLSEKGIGRDLLGEAMEESLGGRGDDRAYDHELAAALVLARKRRLGPFSPVQEPDTCPDARHDTRQEHMKVLAVFARAGFARDVAEHALSLEAGEAEDRVMALRSS